VSVEHVKHEKPLETPQAIRSIAFDNIPWVSLASSRPTGKSQSRSLMHTLRAILQLDRKSPLRLSFGALCVGERKFLVNFPWNLERKLKVCEFFVC
jgi:hypothetical protein